MADQSTLHPPKRVRTTTTDHHQNQKATTSTSSSNPTTSIIIISDLLDELSIEILSRLPVKSLLQLKTISKSWHKIISSPNFTKTHLLKSINNPNLTHHHLIFSSLRPQVNLRRCSLPSLIRTDVPPFTNADEVDYPMKHPHKSVMLVGSVNGLVCVAIEENDMFLWNPSLRKSKKLPRLAVKRKRGYYILYGFGYDASSDDYKVVGISCVFKSASSCVTEVKVYSRNSDRWSRIGGFDRGIPLDDSGKFMNGKLHWATSPAFGLSGEWTIVSLDMGDETYGEVEQPDYGEGKFDLILGVLGGWICVLCNRPKTCVDIWVMKEYAVRESWCKFVNFSYTNDPENYLYEPPLILLGSGELLLVFGSMFLLYNPKDDSRRYFEINEFDACLEGLIYVESLVSPSNAAEGRCQNEY